jgi:hypothetical protein
MELESGGSRRLLRPLLIAVLLAASLAIPSYLWLTRGRDLPLTVLLDPPTYVAAPGQRVPLRLRVEPAAARREVTLTFQGPGVDVAQDQWVAPAKPGTYTVRVTARRSGTTVKDGVSFQVLAGEPDALPLERPPAPSVPPVDLARCPGRAPAIELHGEVCAGSTVVLEAPSGPTIWHREGQGPWISGSWAELVLPRQGPWPVQITSVTVPVRQPPCAWTVRRAVDGSRCQGGPRRGAVFADFSWELISPGHFRFAAKPSRTPGLRFDRYLWDFGDGSRKESTKPRVSHRFAPPLRRNHLVRLEVVAGKTRAAGLRLVIDRTVAH